MIVQIGFYSLIEICTELLCLRMMGKHCCKEARNSGGIRKKIGVTGKQIFRWHIVFILRRIGHKREECFRTVKLRACHLQRGHIKYCRPDSKFPVFYRSRAFRIAGADVMDRGGLSVDNSIHFIAVQILSLFAEPAF